MFTLGIEHQRHQWLCHGRQAGDLARMVHAHLDHTHAVRIAEPQQRERHADVVVEVAPRGKGSLCAQVRHQNGGDHFLGRGLAVAAGDGNQRALETTTPAARQRTQRTAGIGHPQRGHANALGEHFGQHGGRTGVDGSVNESMAIEAVAAQRDVQVTGAYGARIGGDAGEALGAVAEHRDIGQPLVDGAQIKHGAPPGS